jgi:nitrite reductase (NADH) large subunit
MSRRLIIVGNGMAGARLAEQVLSLQTPGAFEIVIYGDEPGGSYNRILLSGVLSGAYAGPDIITHPSGWYADNGISLRSSTRVERVDVSARTVIDERGGIESFDVLVFATGSRPFIPAIAGLDARHLPDGAFVFRTVDDCARMAAAAATARRAVVLGGGLLGLEAARGLIAHGVQAAVVHLGSHVMDTQLDSIGGQTLCSELERMGLTVLTGTRTTGIHSNGRVTGLELASGTRVECDLLVVAAGVVPDTRLARDGGLRVDRGIVVGDDLACLDADGIYAIGDCAEHRGRLYGLVAPAWEQAAVLAARLTGTQPDARYTGSRPSTKLKVAGVDVAVMGDRDAAAGDEVVMYAEPARGVYSRVLVRNDRVAGAILIGSSGAVPSLIQRFLDGTRVPPQRSELLFPSAADAAPRSVEEMPDTARVCDCNAVVKAQIVDAVLKGARSVRSVCEWTRAGSGCGSCRPEVQRIVDFTCRELESSTGGAHAST